MNTTKPCWVVNAGRIAYDPAFDLQREIVAARKSGAVPDVLVFCEHSHVITLGRNGATSNLLAGRHVLEQMNVEFCETDRGGDITYHGPGQIVGYPILDLTQHRRDVRWYVEQLEEVMIRTAADYGISAHRVLCKHGIWIDGAGRAGLQPRCQAEPQGGALAPQAVPAADGGKSVPARDEEKLAAVGVHLSRWVTSHGFAFNVSTDLRYFDLIVPCGLVGKRATSLERALGRAVSIDEARARLTAHFTEVFGFHSQTLSLDEWKAAIDRKPIENG
jgi:lipoyl(octanoyl) transferase